MYSEDQQVTVQTLTVRTGGGPVPVAAYCRVSTEDASQEASLEIQGAHWARVIAGHPGWVPAGIYAERESGTHANTRPELMRLIEDCAAGRVAVILTKSVSRFSRNTVDCLSLVRTLKALGVRIVFEKEHIDTGEMSSELFLSIMASFAAEESRSISQNVKLGYRHRFQNGQYYYKRPPYGYTSPEGELVVAREEAAIVEEIFGSALRGLRPSEIAAQLTERGISTKYNAAWTANTVLAIVSNLTYTGDALLQKTFKDEDYKARRNRGELAQYYIADHHEAIVSREVFVLANARLGLPDPYARITPAEDDDMEDGESDRQVRVIKAAPREKGEGAETLRVAAYCRVSTDLEEQESSYEAQCGHYRDLIVNHPGWTLVGIYADEGISGTSLKHREGFNRMLEDAEAGRIDLILTKSISRFARNTLDCLTVIRKLRAKSIGVSFEKEGIDTLDGTGEVILTILASIAQQESASISQNIRLGIQYRFQQGKPMINTARFLGYDKDGKGRLVINEAEAAVVRRVYRDFLDGLSVDMIAGDLRRECVKSGSGCTTWHTSAVRYILTNEKYAGDLLLQKTLVEDFLTHKMVWNKGQLPQYYVRDAHPAIVPRTVFDRAAEELWMRGSHAPRGGTRFGSRKALIGRTFCACGGRMRRLKRREPMFICESCGAMATEAALRKQVLTALEALPERAGEIQAMIDENQAALKSGDREARAAVLRRMWYLGNLLPLDRYAMSFKAECVDEADFRARTGKRVTEWSDEEIVRLLERVVPGESVTFKGGVKM